MRFWQEGFWPLRFWRGTRGHVSDNLSALADGVLPAEQSARISEHLEHCESCRKEYDAVHFGAALAAHLVQAKAPEGLWSSLARRWEDGTAATLQARAHRLATASLAAGAATAALVLIVAAAAYFDVLRRGARPVDGSGGAASQAASARPATASVAPESAPGRFDLEAYVEPVMAAPREQSFRVISTALPNFVSVGRQDALRTAGLSLSATDMTPLPGYRLVSYRASRIAGAPVVQLIYGNGKQGFSVFVAPRGVEFSFGSGSCVETHVEGVHCQKLACPYQETYSFSQGPFHCVLVSKSLSAPQAAAVMSYFISAQKSPRDTR